METRRKTNARRAGAHPDVFGVLSSAGAGDKPNDDACDVFSIGCGDHELYVAIAADGVTSTNGGAQAAQLAVSSVKQVLTSTLSGRSELPSHVEVRRAVDDAVAYAEYRIKMAAQNAPGQREMSTTLVVALVVGRILYVAHIGDSRTYLCRRDNIYRLTIDHSVVEQLIRDGELTRDEAEHDPRRSRITRYLGPDLDAETDHTVVMPGSDDSHEQLVEYIEVQDTDIILVCTDGLTKKVSEAEIQRTVAQHSGDMPQCASSLVHLAVQQRRERDNVTVVLVKVSGAGTAPRKVGGANSARLFLFLLSLLMVVILGAAAISTLAAPGPTEAVTPNDRLAAEATQTSSATPTLPAGRVVEPTVGVIPSASAPTAVSLPTATATLVFLSPPLDPPAIPSPTPSSSDKPEDPTIQQSPPISKSAIVDISFVTGQAIEVILDSSVLSDEIGSGRVDICLEVLEDNREESGGVECRNLWDAFSVADENLEDIGCMRLPSTSQIACALSGAELAKEYVPEPNAWTNAVLYVWSLRQQCDGVACRDRVLARQEMSSLVAQ